MTPPRSRAVLRYLLVAVGCLALGVFVGTRVRTQGQASDGRGGGPGGSLFTMFDGNGDQSLSAAEMDGAPAVLRGRDRNADGRLTADELPVMGRGGRGGPGGRGRGDEPGETPATSANELVETLMLFDENSDGKLTKAELPERFQSLLDRADANKDGQLTPDEIRASAATQAQPADEGGGRGRGGPGRGGFGFEGRGGRGGPGGDPIMTALDANADMAIDAGEINASPKALRTLDRDNDGVLSLMEVAGRFGGLGGGGGQRGGRE